VSHIAFVNNSGFGHVIPTLDVVGALVERGHRVTYVTAEGPVDKVAATGATVVPYKSRLPELDLSTVVNTQDGTARLPGIYLTESEGIITAMEDHFVAEKPDLIVYDVTVYHAGRILARKWGVPAAQFTPVFASNERFKLFDAMFPNADRSGLRHPALVEFFRRMTGMLASYGQADTPLMEFVARIEGLNLCSATRSFQFAGDTFDERFVFVGPTVRHGVDEGDWTPPASGHPVVLISLGTTVNRRSGFWESCSRAFGDLPWHVVLAVGDGIDEREVAQLPPNIEALSWVPYLTVAEHSDVVVTHGGFGSILGALYRGKPVVVVPDSPEANVNARRVAELGLGRVIREFSADRLRNTVLDLAADKQSRQRALAMREDILNTGGGATGAQAIEAYLARS
jgi:MGT family glycosyltransferase